MLCSIADAGEQYEIHILCDAPEAKTACRRGKQIMIQFHHTGRELSYTASAAGSGLMIKLTEPAEKQVMAVKILFIL